MEYLPGGDLMALLMKLDTFTEEATRQYMAEVAMAVNSVHELGYIHRDLKPGAWALDTSNRTAATAIVLDTEPQLHANLHHHHCRHRQTISCSTGMGTSS